jgi:hypothetical protein
LLPEPIYWKYSSPSPFLVYLPHLREEKKGKGGSFTKVLLKELD